MQVRLFSLLFACLWCAACEQESYSPPAPSASDTTSVYFVRPGGLGAGSQNDPFGSLALALEQAYQNPRIEAIHIATGTYTSSVRIRSSIRLEGGFDPVTWEKSITDSTTIVGTTLDDISVAIAINRLSSRVELRSLTIVGGTPSRSGAGSYGLQVIDVSSLTISDCTILGGAARDGAAGWDGLPAAQGESGASQAPGLLPTAGGAGGTGGANSSREPTAGQPGQPGRCADGLFGSGQPGAGGQTSPNPVTSGSDGADGEHGQPGSDGNGGLARLQLLSGESLLEVVVPHGEDGSSGTHGCGGAGGGGSTSISGANYNYAGYPGGGGGAGGYGGEGGLGGESGGCSVAILAINSEISLRDCLIGTVAAGDGASGGAGGLGGIGGAGGLGTEQLFARGGNGGTGGTGGPGGHGGGGAGGWSIGIAFFNALVIPSTTSFQLQPAGQGGSGISISNAGEAGVAADLFMLTQQSSDAIPGDKIHKNIQ